MSAANEAEWSARARSARTPAVSARPGGAEPYAEQAKRTQRCTGRGARPEAYAAAWAAGERVDPRTDALRRAFVASGRLPRMEAVQVVDLARVFAASAMLAGAAWLDLRSRRVANRYWTPWLAAAAVFAAADLAVREVDPRVAWVWVGALASLVVFYVLWWARLLFGGADAKAFMVLALLVPWPVTTATWSLSPAVDTLVNATVASLTVPVVLLVWNLARGRVAGVATFVAVPLPVATARRRHVWPVERADASGGVTRRLWQRRGEDLEEVYAGLEAVGLTEVWVTPKVPFLAFAVPGWLVAVAWGNVMLAGVAWILS